MNFRRKCRRAAFFGTSWKGSVFLRFFFALGLCGSGPGCVTVMASAVGDPGPRFNPVSAPASRREITPAAPGEAPSEAPDSPAGLSLRNLDERSYEVVVRDGSGTTSLWVERKAQIGVLCPRCDSTCELSAPEFGRFEAPCGKVLLLEGGRLREADAAP